MQRNPYEALYVVTLMKYRSQKKLLTLVWHHVHGSAAAVIVPDHSSHRAASPFISYAAFKPTAARPFEF